MKLKDIKLLSPQRNNKGDFNKSLVKILDNTKFVINFGNVFDSMYLEDANDDYNSDFLNNNELIPDEAQYSYMLTYRSPSCVIYP